MKALWAIEPVAFEAFLRGMALQMRAGQDDENPYFKIEMDHTAALIQAGSVDDAKRAGLPVEKTSGMAIVSLAGPMVKRASPVMKWFGFTGSNDVRAALRAAVADDDVQQVMLRIDSPGGTVDGTAELAEDVRKAAAVKPVFAQVDGTAASAAYWVASQATGIFAGRMDLTGSIGVRMMIYDFSAMFEEAGIRAVPIDTGPFKSAGAQGTHLTEDQQAYFQGLVDDTFSEFKRAVQTGRQLSDSQFAAVGDGRVFSAPDALELGLIDRIQTIDETVSRHRQQVTRKARLALSITA